jgi:phosphatidylglycerophosphate synthase
VAAACLFVAAALGIQLRLLCNLFDGMVAVEGGFRTKSGEIFNELPDRFADAFILIGAGYAASSVQYGVTLGWVAAVLAVITAYVRTLGAAAGAGQCFLGPMAKQHRMAVMTAACVLAAVGVFMNAGAQVVSVALLIVVSGTLLTIVRRTRHIIQTLEAS